MAWIVFDNSNFDTDKGEVVKAYRDEADAVSVAQLLSNYQSVDAGELPVWFKPGVYWNGSVLTYDLPISSLAALKEATRSCSAQLKYWAQELDEEGRYHLTEYRNLGHDFLVRARQGLYLVSRSSNVAWTHIIKIKFANLLSRGSSDISSARDFYEQVESIPEASYPIKPTIWVNLASTDSEGNLSPERVKLEEARATSELQSTLNEVIPPSVFLSDDAWIDELT